ncbi:unnamed protein product [Vitrella brassicaformis CCMP3155]|uniref:non-specific serine/threonine protein kinase n=3 Tax=Vitrella brassicaformis TaxID=1169539 RepID=A0A0G4FVP8_VITBC|nr:unnamed protein product [Vitrella brassicaformis CCMP3155]|eukprot:CEM18804.1 unnamed protein product [Vitrella brassicaformis CCMP3155]
MHKYKRVRVVGKGSFGSAVLVTDRDGRSLIVKTIDISRMEAKQKKDAVNEVKVMSSLRHPYVVTYRESFIENDQLCIVMDYCEGGDLYKKISAQRQTNRPFPERTIIRWFTQLCLALKHVHERHILHRDLKSQNIFLTGKGGRGPGAERIKLGDFGIARVLQHTQDYARTAIGTPYYLSPEICQERPYSYKSDICLGCVLYECCTLRHAFDADSMRGLVMKILKGHYPPISQSFSPDIRQLVDDMLQKDPAKRPSIQAILNRGVIQQQIKTFLEEEEGRQAPLQPQQKPQAPESPQREQKNDKRERPSPSPAPSPSPPAAAAAAAAAVPPPPPAPQRARSESRDRRVSRDPSPGIGGAQNRPEARRHVPARHQERDRKVAGGGGGGGGPRGGGGWAVVPPSQQQQQKPPAAAAAAAAGGGPSADPFLVQEFRDRMAIADSVKRRVLEDRHGGDQGQGDVQNKPSTPPAAPDEQPSREGAGGRDGVRERDKKRQEEKRRWTELEEARREYHHEKIRVAEARRQKIEAHIRETAPKVHHKQEAPSPAPSTPSPRPDRKAERDEHRQGLRDFLAQQRRLKAKEQQQQQDGGGEGVEVKTPSSAAAPSLPPRPPPSPPAAPIIPAPPAAGEGDGGHPALPPPSFRVHRQVHPVGMARSVSAEAGSSTTTTTREEEGVSVGMGVVQPRRRAITIDEEGEVDVAVAVGGEEEGTDQDEELLIATLRDGLRSGEAPSEPPEPAAAAAAQEQPPEGASEAERGREGHLMSHLGRELASLGVAASEQDTMGVRIESLKMYLEQEVGLDAFLAAYRYLQQAGDAAAGADDQAEGGEAFPPSVGPYLPLIHQLIVCEDHYFSTHGA